MRHIMQQRGAESARHPHCHFFSQLPKPRASSSSHKCRPSQILSRSLLNPQPKPQMNPSCRSRGYQRVTHYAGIHNIIPLILDLGARLNLTIDFDEASQAAAALMPVREEIIRPTKWSLLVRTPSATSTAQHWSTRGREKFCYTVL